MRFLKNKILLARAALDSSTRSAIQTSSPPEELEDLMVQHTILGGVEHTPITTPNPSRKTVHRRGQETQEGNKKRNGRCSSSTKNIVINYGKAIISFASSHLAHPYLQAFLEEEQVTLADFVAYVKRVKRTIVGIESFRSLYIVSINEDPKVAACKRLFKYISEVFIKFFSVNWITHGKVVHKLIYLKYRFKMLRRIQSPEHFTYIKEHRRAAKD